MKKIGGYVLAIAGLVALVINSGIFSIEFEIINSISSYLLIGGVVLIVVGVFLVLISKESKNKQAEEEVPIYEGTGKKRKIVGYRKS